MSVTHDDRGPLDSGFEGIFISSRMLKDKIVGLNGEPLNGFHSDGVESYAYIVDGIVLAVFLIGPGCGNWHYEVAYPLHVSAMLEAFPAFKKPNPCQTVNSGFQTLWGAASDFLRRWS